jgi:putative monooxygenase
MNLFGLVAPGGQSDRRDTAAPVRTQGNDMVVNAALTESPEPTAVHSRPHDRPIVLVQSSEINPDRRRGGEIRTLLSPRNAGSVSGFSGVVLLQPGERVAEHYHPYSEEFLYVAEGDATADLDGEPWELAPGAALLIPPGTRHRVRNTGAVQARIVFHLGPLAPRPELGHVDTEGRDRAGQR